MLPAGALSNADHHAIQGRAGRRRLSARRDVTGQLRRYPSAVSTDSRLRRHALLHQRDHSARPHLQHESSRACPEWRLSGSVFQYAFLFCRIIHRRMRGGSRDRSARIPVKAGIPLGQALVRLPACRRRKSGLGASIAQRRRQRDCHHQLASGGDARCRHDHVRRGAGQGEPGGRTHR
jgi:hypothetical protein